MRTINGFTSTADIKTYTEPGLYTIVGLNMTSNPPISNASIAGMVVLGHDPANRVRLLYTENKIFLSIGSGNWIEK